MYGYSEIKKVTLEVSELCNVNCPMCARNIRGGVTNPHLSNAQLTLTDIKKILEPKFVEQLNCVEMCGSYGEPITAQDTKEIFSYLRSINSNMQLIMHTNGSARTMDWWSQLPKAMGENHIVSFAIDGLEDTNHIYRQGASWPKIMANVNAFIQAGGKAKWQFIVFAHNEHQVEEAELFSKKIGFKFFEIVKTNRFYVSALNLNTPGIQAVNHKEEETFFIEPPKNPIYQNEVLKTLMKKYNPSSTKKENYKDTKNKWMNRKPEKYNLDFSTKNGIEKIWDKVTIDCKVAKEKSIYVTAEGYILPCCWIGSDIYNPWFSFKGTQIWKLINEIGAENINAKNKSLQSIIDGNFFQKAIPESWKKNSCAEGKLNVCARICGINHDTFSAQRESSSKKIIENKLNFLKKQSIFFKTQDFNHVSQTINKFYNNNTDIFDAFAKTQYISKIWLILKLLNYIDLSQKHKIYVFGGWYGFLPFLLFNADNVKIDKIYNIDMDKNCEEVSHHLNKNNKNYAFVNADMKDWNEYDSNPIVINTSFEHVDDETYKIWYDKIPKDALIILQSNNLFRIKEHIRCCNNLQEFENQSLMTNILWKGETYVDQYKEYKRFMIIGKKA